MDFTSLMDTIHYIIWESIEINITIHFIWNFISNFKDGITELSSSPGCDVTQKYN